MSSHDSAASGLADTLVVVIRARWTMSRSWRRDLRQCRFYSQRGAGKGACGKGPVKLGDLVNDLRGVVDSVQRGLLDQLDSQSSDGARSAWVPDRPRNNYVIREGGIVCNDTPAYNSFGAEWRQKNGWHRAPSAWELVEGNDRELCDAFATYAAHTLANSRLFSSTQAAYLGVQPAGDAIMLRTTLAKLVQRAVGYVQRAPPRNS